MLYLLRELVHESKSNIFDNHIYIVDIREKKNFALIKISVISSSIKKIYDLHEHI